MDFRSSPGPVIAAFILLAAAARPAHGQPAEQVGDFSVEVRADSVTGDDRSFATLWPEGRVFSMDVETGPLLLACGRDTAALSGAVMLPAYGSTGDTLPVVVRVGSSAPDTLVLEGEEGIVWFMRAPDVAALFGGALRADSLFIELLTPVSGEPARYAYGVAGMDTVLGRLGCAAVPSGPGRLNGRRIIRTETAGMVQLSAMSLPRARGPRELMRYLEANYPRELWDARVEGEVSVKFRVMEDGSVDPASIQVVRSTHEAFEAAAGLAVRRICFNPATAYGRPVKVWIEQPIRFVPPRRRPRARLDDSPPPACPPPRAW